MLPLTPTTSGREENGNQATSAGSPPACHDEHEPRPFCLLHYGCLLEKRMLAFKAPRSLSSNTPFRTSEPDQRLVSIFYCQSRFGRLKFIESPLQLVSANHNQ